MTDIFAPTQESAPAPAPEPITTTATIVSESAPVPAPRSSFDDNLDEFLGRDLLSEMAPASSAPTPPSPAEPAAPAPVAPAASPGAPNATGAPALSQPAPANGGTPPATTTQPAPAGVTAPKEVDPGLLLQMFTGEPAAPAPAQPAAAAAPTPAAQPESSEIPMPFTAQMNLPDTLVATIFESEDPVQRKAALSSLMAALGNAVVGYTETRFNEVLAPRMAQQMQAAQVAQAQAAAVGQHFYGKYPELAQYKQVVERAGKIVMGQNPNAAYSEELAEQIASLARGALAQMGKPVASTAPAAAPAAQPAAPAAPQPTAPRPVATPYMAGGATPGGPLDAPADSNSPGAVFDEMQSLWG